MANNPKPNMLDLEPLGLNIPAFIACGCIVKFVQYPGKQGIHWTAWDETVPDYHTESPWNVYLITGNETCY